MVTSDATPSNLPPTRPEPIVGRRRNRLAQAVPALGVALVIVLAAWFVGGRAGFDQIGRGGVNQRHLPKVGEVAPDFMSLDEAGNPVWLSDFRGQPVWVNFWGSWCPPCRAEMPDLERAYQKLAPQGVVLMAVSIDESLEVAAEYARKNGASYPVVNIPQRGLIAPAYDLWNVPTHLFIDANGVVRAVVPGQLDAEMAVAHGESLLALDGTPVA